MTAALRSFTSSGKKIIAIGRNYAAHAKELNNAVPTTPFFFLKPTTCYTANTKAGVEVPEGVEVHHEVELGVIIGQGGSNIPTEKAMKHIGGYCLAIDYTGRNLQEIVKKKGLPWSAAKGYDTWCPVGDFIDAKEIKDVNNLNLWYKVNGVTKQEGSTSDMIFKIPELIAYVSNIMTLEKGDLIITGTPEGVGRVLVGDKITAGLQQDGKDLTTIEHTMIEKSTAYKVL